jgi:hypothetical protein
MQHEHPIEEGHGRELDSLFESGRKVHLNRSKDQDSGGHGRAMVGRKPRSAHLTEQVAGVNEAAVAVRPWTMKGCELNLLAWTMNER